MSNVFIKSESIEKVRTLLDTHGVKYSEVKAKSIDPSLGATIVLWIAGKFINQVLSIMRQIVIDEQNKVSVGEIGFLKEVSPGDTEEDMLEKLKQSEVEMKKFHESE